MTLAVEGLVLKAFELTLVVLIGPGGAIPGWDHMGSVDEKERP